MFGQVYRLHPISRRKGHCWKDSSPLRRMNRGYNPGVRMYRVKGAEIAGAEGGAGVPIVGCTVGAYMRNI